MIASHNDLDHYGGLWDLLNVKFINELDCESVRVNAFYHAGLAWWKKGTSGRTLGPHETTDNGSFFTQLMGDRPAVEAALQPGAGKRLQGNWSDLMRSVVATKTQTGAATPITRISHATDHLPGFAPPATIPAAGEPGDPAIKVLGPVEFQIGNAPAIRRFTSADSQNTNGNSVLLRIDYGRSRILMTGDLNRNSQRSLLADYTGERQQFECDVAKACHHGSNDVSYEFLQAMRPAVTVISSGDNEGHDHPRPTIVAASATTGFLSIENDELVSPLIYATEIARSVLIGRPNQLTIAPPANAPVTARRHRRRWPTISSAARPSATASAPRANRKATRKGGSAKRMSFTTWSTGWSTSAPTARRSSAPRETNRTRPGTSAKSNHASNLQVRPRA